VLILGFATVALIAETVRALLVPAMGLGCPLGGRTP
jgi:hypothetical protein